MKGQLKILIAFAIALFPGGAVMTPAMSAENISYSIKRNVADLCSADAGARAEAVSELKRLKEKRESEWGKAVNEVLMDSPNPLAR